MIWLLKLLPAFFSFFTKLLATLQSNADRQAGRNEQAQADTKVTEERGVTGDTIETDVTKMTDEQLNKELQ